MDYYVSPTGNDSASGSFSAPFRTIAHAFDIAQSGDDVYSWISKEKAALLAPEPLAFPAHPPPPPASLPATIGLYIDGVAVASETGTYLSYSQTLRIKRTKVIQHIEVRLT